MGTLIEYIRKPGKMVEFVNEKTGEKKMKFQKGKPYGCLVSVLQDNTISVGWSLCSPRDEWDRDVAQNLAWARATMCENMDGAILVVPQSIAAQFEEFVFRSMKYFQTDVLTTRYGYEYTIIDECDVTVRGFKFIS